jgi:hypothetical protein
MGFKMNRAEFTRRLAAIDAMQQIVLAALSTVPAADHGVIFRLGLAWSTRKGARLEPDPDLPEFSVIADVQTELQRLGLHDLAARISNLGPQ